MDVQLAGIGIDIGGPIIRAKGGSTPEGYRLADPTPGAFAALARLSAAYGDRVRLISQCDTLVQAAKLEWMAEHRFCETTGVAADRIHFVRRMPEKASVCIRYGLTHMIEDKPEILNFALGEVPNLYLFSPDPAEVARFPELAAAAVVVAGWDDLLPLLLG